MTVLYKRSWAIVLRDACVVVVKASTTIGNLGIVLEFFRQTGTNFFDVLCAVGMPIQLLKRRGVPVS